MDGVLVVDKPAGPTSHDVVSAVRKALRIKKVGHTGTLDPVATGILPLVLGKATKVARYLTGTEKRYVATIRLGVTTDTLDAEGNVLSEKPVDVSREQLLKALTQFTGNIEQVPPMFSAKKIAGKRLYELAREGKEIEREAKKVHVGKLELTSFESTDAVVEVNCSAGTYVRVLAQDIGEVLGCGAYLHHLRRTGAGPFGEDAAVKLEAIVDDAEGALQLVIPMEQALSGLKTIQVPQVLGRRICSGYQLCAADLRTLDIPEFAAEEPVTITVDGGGLVAVARTLIAVDELPMCRRDRRALKTERVFGGN